MSKMKKKKTLLKHCLSYFKDPTSIRLHNIYTCNILTGLMCDDFMCNVDVNVLNV